jgi:HSP20 family molecular chaperone IbpA
MLMRFDPFRDVERWAHQLSAGTKAGLMPMDAYRQGDHWMASFALPGFAGVLTVRLPVADHAKPRKVTITTGGGQQAIEAGSQAA